MLAKCEASMFFTKGGHFMSEQSPHSHPQDQISLQSIPTAEGVIGPPDESTCTDPITGEELDALMARMERGMPTD